MLPFAIVLRGAIAVCHSALRCHCLSSRSSFFCWRTHKCRLKKKYFKPNKTEGNNLKNRPPIVPLEQWKILVKFWKSDTFKARSEKNKTSRATLTSIHTTGSKTFAEIRDEETMKNPEGREPSRVEMYIMTHKPKNGNPMNEGTNRIVSELEDAMALHPQVSEQCSSRDDLISQVLGKDRHGYVRTYGKGVVPSDLWGTNSQAEIQKLIDNVKKNAQVEIESLQKRMHKEMELKLKEQVEAVKTELLGGFGIVLTQLQKCFPEIVIPNLFSIPNDEQAVDARSSATTHACTEQAVGGKNRKEEKAHKKQCKKEIHIAENLIEVKKEAKRSKEHKAQRVTAEKDPNMLEHPPTAFVLFLERFRKECKESDFDSENNVQMFNKMALKTWKSMTNEDKKYYLEKAAKLKGKYEKVLEKSSANIISLS